MRLVFATVICLFFICGAAAELPSSGPTAYLSYDEKAVIKNPIDVFMYFIPLTTPARVALEKSPENSQTVWITGYELNEKKDSFTLRCEFTIDGTGYYVNRFNPQDIIAINTRNLDKPQTTTHLENMRFEGAGYGALEITGNYIERNTEITGLTVSFTDRGAKSPLIVGLYSVDPVDGSYEYENRYDFARARISSLSFQKTGPGETPLMKVKLSTLGNATSPDGFLASVKAAVANMFVTPVEITAMGNQALLRFAEAIYLKNNKFTFPQAENLVMRP